MNSMLPGRVPAALIVACAMAAHAANRAHCIAHGDYSQPNWEDAPDWQKNSAFEGVKAVLRGSGPEELHESWMAQKRDEGWVYGEVKDPEKKEHPCMVPYHELPPEQQAKDHLFRGVVSSMLKANGVDLSTKKED